MKISFSAYEYQTDEVFHQVEYRYQGCSEKGWDIFRNNQRVQSLGSGYVLLKSLYCGICSTDIARAKLPFPLPQITGHEVIALYQDKPVAVEINASHLARGLKNVGCFYCDQGLGNHCPERLTLGIDRLPGGFSPYILAPIKALCSVPKGINLSQSSVIEPFAAALHAVASSNIKNGFKIAIVGPKRLGLLLILALSLYRIKTKLTFEISAIIRHRGLTDACMTFGADEVLLVDDIDSQKYDLVYDTSGSISGFQLSLSISKETLHMKSTHGLPFGGFLYLTQMVIDELSLISLDGSNRYNRNNLEVSLLNEKNHAIFLDSSVPQSIKSWIVKGFPDKHIVQVNLSITSAKEMNKLLPKSRFLKFDLAIVTSIDQLNKLLNFPEIGSLLRAKGDIHWANSEEAIPQPWLDFFRNNLSLRTSRCGDFSRAISLIDENSALFSKIISGYVSACYNLSDINLAFKLAKTDVTSIKLVIEH